jgi:hypothetical protein
MPSCCCVQGCSTCGGLSFPKDEALRKQWIIAIKGNSNSNRFKFWTPHPRSVVCRKHFTEADFVSETIYGRLKICYLVLTVLCWNIIYFFFTAVINHNLIILFSKALSRTQSIMPTTYLLVRGVGDLTSFTQELVLLKCSKYCVEFKLQGNRQPGFFNSYDINQNIRCNCQTFITSEFALSWLFCYVMLINWPMDMKEVH